MAVRRRSGWGPSWDLATISLSDLATSTMPRAARKNVPRKLGITEYRKKKNMVELSMSDLAICWCKGIGVGCGRELKPSTRRKHRKNERLKAERGQCGFESSKNTLTLSFQ